MNEQLNLYIQRQLAIGSQAMSRKVQADDSSQLPTRTIWVLLRKYVKDFLESTKGDRWIVMPGLRGVGKTTMVAQAYLWLESKHKSEINLIYISLDEVVEKLNSNLSETLDAYESILGCSFEDLNKPTFIFLDEIQVDPSWARILKFIYERSDRIFFLCTGSSATHLQMDADVAGRRAKIDKLYPLNFPEFQRLAHGSLPMAGLKQKLIRALYYSASAKEVYQELCNLEVAVNQQWIKYNRHDLTRYITVGTMPFTLRHDNRSDVYLALNTMIDKIVRQDLQSLRSFNTESIMATQRLLFILAEINDIANLANLSKWAGISISQVQYILDALVKTELLIKVPAYGSHVNATRYPARYHFMSPALRAAQYSIVGNPATEAGRQGLLLEDIAALHFYREFNATRKGHLTYPYDKHGGGCDFILKIADEHQIAIEIGRGKKDSSQVRQTLAKIKCRYGLVYSQSELELSADQSTVSVPLDYFLLM